MPKGWPADNFNTPVLKDGIRRLMVRLRALCDLPIGQSLTVAVNSFPAPGMTSDGSSSPGVGIADRRAAISACRLKQRQRTTLWC